mmetsp:Transcript_25818/g.86776  ORF Transcript_25818/g.86776 Transcript_25818/m.86776 type:complete len:237 (+) Transcript_25818:174-884(+)
MRYPIGIRGEDYGVMPISPSKRRYSGVLAPAKSRTTSATSGSACRCAAFSRLEKTQTPNKGGLPSRPTTGRCRSMTSPAAPAARATLSKLTCRPPSQQTNFEGMFCSSKVAKQRAPAWQYSSMPPRNSYLAPADSSHRGKAPLVVLAGPFVETLKYGGVPVTKPKVDGSNCSSTPENALKSFSKTWQFAPLKAIDRRASLKESGCASIPVPKWIRFSFEALQATIIKTEPMPHPRS